MCPHVDSDRSEHALYNMNISPIIEPFANIFLIKSVKEGSKTEEQYSTKSGTTTCMYQ